MLNHLGVKVKVEDNKEIDRDCINKVINIVIVKVDMEEVIIHKVKEAIIHKEDKVEDNMDKVENIEVVIEVKAFINKLSMEVV